MAQGASDAGGRVTADPETIRAEMAQTRAALTRELGALKSRVLGTPAPARKGGKRTVPQKTKSASKRKSASKSKPAASARKTSPSRGKQSGRGRSSRKGGGNRVAKVIGDALAGAAVGAVKGAAEAVAADLGGPGRGEKGQSQKSM